MMATSDNKPQDGKEKKRSIVTQSFSPSHILQDGRFIHLPPPNEYERSKFFERAIAKFGLLEADMTTTAKEQQKEQEQEKEESKETAPRVHPLAIASARLQASGIAELNRAINLSTLVNSGEYFGLTNIVDPSLELGAAKEGAPPASATDRTQGDATTKSSSSDAPAQAATTVTAPAPATHPNAGLNEKEMQEEQRIKSAYVLKRKRAVFDKASRFLLRHEKRLKAAIQAQAVPDERLRQLRHQWRLVAPEHGTRAKPHAARPTEVVAVDVDVYDPTGGRGNTLVGRLASKVPRYATIELTDQYINEQVPKSNIKNRGDENKDEDQGTHIKEEEDAMDIDNPQEEEKASDDQVRDDRHNGSKVTRAEPFAIADPTLGRISTDFDPDKVRFLTLQFDIEKPSTGFCMSSCLEPMATTKVGKVKELEKKEKEDGNQVKREMVEEKKTENEMDNLDTTYADDEQVLVSLQHSLFCAKLFESIRKELMGDDTTEQHGQHKQHQQAAAWLSSESEENFLPPPSLMVRPTSNSAGAGLCVIHCHASEVKVQLDNEYTLRPKLVEADQQVPTPLQGNPDAEGRDSGSQTPEQLLLLCRSLLLHAQEVYHNHSLHESRAAAEKQWEEEHQKQEADKPRGLDRIQKKDIKTLPKILQNCVALGTKMLFEQRIRRSLTVRKDEYCFFGCYISIISTLSVG